MGGGSTSFYVQKTSATTTLSRFILFKELQKSYRIRIFVSAILLLPLYVPADSTVYFRHNDRMFRLFQ